MVATYWQPTAKTKKKEIQSWGGETDQPKALPRFSESFDYNAPERTGTVTRGQVPTFDAPAQRDIPLALPTVENPTLDLSGIPTTEQITASAGRQYGILKAISDAATQQEMTSLARRLSGDTSSPIYQAIASNIQGGGAARTGRNIVEANQRAQAEAMSAGIARANLGLGEINAQQNAARINSSNRMNEADFAAGRDRDAFDRAATEADFELRANQQQFGQDVTLRELENSEDYQAWQRMMAEKGFSLEESQAIFEQEFAKRRQDYLEREGDRRFDLDTDRFDWEKESGTRSLDLTEEDNDWKHNFYNRQQRLDQNQRNWENNFAENELDWAKTKDRANAQLQNAELGMRMQDSYWDWDTNNRGLDIDQQKLDWDMEPWPNTGGVELLYDGGPEPTEQASDQPVQQDDPAAAWLDELWQKYGW